MYTTLTKISSPSEFKNIKQPGQGLNGIEKSRSTKRLYKTNTNSNPVINKQTKSDPNNMFEGMDPKAYINGFNGFTQYLKDYDYQSKNESLFTWNMQIHQYKRTQLPEFKPIPTPNKEILAYERTNAEMDLLKNLYEFYSPANRKNHYAPLPYKLDLLAKTPNNDNLTGFDQNENIKNESKNFISRKKSQKILKNAKKYQQQNIKTDKKAKELNSLGESNIETMNNFGLRTTTSDFFQIPKMRTSTSIPRMQRVSMKYENDDILSARSTHNEDYFLNSLNRKNLMINKVISHLNIDEKNVDKNEIMATTISKIQKTVRDIKLHEQIIIKPKTPGKEYTSRSIIKMNSQTERNALDYSKKPNLSSKINKNSMKASLNPNEINRNRFLNIPDAESIKNFNEDTQALKSESDQRTHLASSYSFRSSNQINAILNGRKKGDSGIGIGMGMSKNEYFESRNKIKELDEMLTMFQDKLNERNLENASNDKNRVQSSQTDRPNTTKNFMAINLIDEFMKNRPNTTNNQNFLNYNAYFKNKYMEKGLHLDISNNLKKRCDDMEKEVRESLKRLKDIPNNNSQKDKQI